MTMNNWTKEELRDTIIEYKNLQISASKNEKVKKSDIYNRLSEKYGRTPKSYGRRFSNISYVLTLAGREWLQGLKPLSNVGPNVIKEIEEILAEIESRPVGNIALPLPNIKVIPRGNPKPKKINIEISSFTRDQEVIAWVRLNANGNCELCQNPAPFQDALENPFLEVHHVKQLADGGSDTIHNAVALCPNCHREMHHGKNFSERKDFLYKKIDRLIKE